MRVIGTTADQSLLGFEAAKEAMKAVDIDFAVLMAERVIPRESLSAKVILSGELKRKITLKGVKASKGARAAIEKAGGKYEEPAAKPAPEKKLAAKEKKAKE